MVKYKAVNNKIVEMTAEEEAIVDARDKAWADDAKNRKLSRIKNLRRKRLEATDWMANSDYTMPNYIKSWRQSLRDIPANFTNESDYDSLLELEGSGDERTLKHTIWKQPTE